MDSSKKKLESHYNPRITQFEESYKILDWESREAQMARFQVLLDNVPLEGKTLLDVGCGCGDLYGLIKQEGVSAVYTGVDLLPEMAAKAKEFFPEAAFFCGDIFSGEFFSEEAGLLPGRTYDVVYTSGIFNLNLGNNREFFEKAIEVLSRLAGEYLVINLLDEASPGRDDTYFYFSPPWAAGKLEALGWQTAVLKGYLNNDFTLVGRRRGL